MHDYQNVMDGWPEYTWPYFEGILD
jgi:hypothetical protein